TTEDTEEHRVLNFGSTLLFRTRMSSEPAQPQKLRTFRVPLCPLWLQIPTFFLYWPAGRCRSCAGIPPSGRIHRPRELPLPWRCRGGAVSRGRTGALPERSAL